MDNLCLFFHIRWAWIKNAPKESYWQKELVGEFWIFLFLHLFEGFMRSQIVLNF